MTRIPRTALALALGLAALPASAAETAPPQARALIDAHVAALGGRQAQLDNGDGTIKATMEIVEAGLKGDLAVYSRGKDKAMVNTLPGFGETRMGRTDGVVWSIDPMTGPRLLEGKERRQVDEQFDPLYAMRDASLVASARTTGAADSDGRACWKVEIRWKSGETTTDCYGKDDGLLLSTESVAASPMGEIKQVTHFSDYTAYGPLKAPKVAKTSVAGMTQRITIQSVDYAVPAADAFALPPAIGALVKKGAAPAK